MPLPLDMPAFIRGFFRNINSNLLADLMDELNSSETGITAFAGGGQTNARQLSSALNVLATVGSAADSVKLPPAKIGRKVFIRNSGANSAQVFGSGTDTINGVATATGVAQGAGLSALYECVDITAAGVGLWHRILSA